MRHDKVALVDMDGTLADYDQAMIRAMKEIAGPNDPEFIPHTDLPDYIENRRQLISKLPGFWSNLWPHRLGFEILTIVIDIGYHVHIFTKGPNQKPRAWSEKVEWVDRHVSGMFREYNGVGHDYDMSIVTFKGLTYGRVLVDDYPQYALDWLENRPRGLVIMPQNEKNKDFKHPNVLLCDGSNMEEVREALQKAFDR